MAGMDQVISSTFFDSLIISVVFSQDHDQQGHPLCYRHIQNGLFVGTPLGLSVLLCRNLRQVSVSSQITLQLALRILRG